MYRDWSRMVSSFKSGGSCDFTRAIPSFTDSITSTVLAPLCRRISRLTVGTPFSRDAERCSLVPSSASPRSLTRTGWPLTVATTRSLKSATFSKRPMVRRVCSRAPEVTLPPGASEFCRSRACRTSVMGMPYAASRPGSIQMLMARSSPPSSDTSPTPLARSSCTLMTLSAYSVSSRSGRFPERAIVSTGELSLLNLAMTGGRVSSGNWRTTVDTRSRMSWAAVSMSRSRSKVAMTIELPPEEMERSSWMPSTVLTASSMRSETSASVSSVEAPGSAVRTETVGRSTEGKRSTPSWP